MDWRTEHLVSTEKFDIFELAKKDVAVRGASDLVFCLRIVEWTSSMECMIVTKSQVATMHIMCLAPDFYEAFLRVAS